MNKFDDIIFSNKNHSYGAYVLRKRQYYVLSLATLVSIFLFSAVFFGMSVYYGVPEELFVEDWIEYDDAVITNPYQSDFQMEKPRGSQKEKDKEITSSIGKDPDVGEMIIGDNSLSISDSNGSDLDSLGGNGIGTSDSSNQSAFNTSKDPNEIYKLLSSLDVLPMFPGGEQARIRYFHDHIKYPKFAIDNRIQGIVYMNFIVEPDSTISNIQVLQGIGAGCDDEAIRAVRAMPKWIPGQKDRRAIRVQITMPLTFSLITQK